MCGILVYTRGSDQTEKLRPLIKKRGPDYFGTIKNKYTFESSVLALREPFTKQPIQENGKTLCYNGQIYGIQGNDTEYLFRGLVENGPHFPFKGVNGEFAFVYFDGDNLWFARDQIGRRSLLYFIDAEKNLIVSSVGLPGFKECQAGLLYKWDGTLTETSISQSLTVTRATVPENTLDLIRSLEAAVIDRMILPPSQKSIAVLFSGGLDCTLLARIMDIVLDPAIKIELLNVAFENKRTGAMFDTPDRKLGIRSHQELLALSKGREIDLVKVNVPYEEAQSYYKLVSDLMYPKHTVMDQSIALAFFCACKTDKRTRSPILISGLGADELFGGYSRHTRAAEAGREALASELELDFNRIGERNLGRDDRVCCYWGKEVRYPFLDYRVVECAMKMDLDLKASSNDTKIILRQIARELGLDAVCLEKKRAIQFGAKSAKMDPGSGRSKGTDALDSSGLRTSY